MNSMTNNADAFEMVVDMIARRFSAAPSETAYQELCLIAELARAIAVAHNRPIEAQTLVGAADKGPM